MSTIIYDSRVERKAELICHYVQVNESIHLSDKSRHDIFFTTRDVAGYWKGYCDEMLRLNYAKRWNEIKLWFKRYPLANVSDIQIAMAMLDNGEYIRDFKPAYMMYEMK